MQRICLSPNTVPRERILDELRVIPSNRVRSTWYNVIDFLYIRTLSIRWSQIIRISRLFCLHLYKSGYSKSFSSSNSERLISTLNCLRKEEMEVESGISTVPSVLLDDDGRPKRTGLLSLSLFSLSFIFSMQFSPLFLTQSLCWLD